MPDEVTDYEDGVGPPGTDANRRNLGVDIRKMRDEYTVAKDINFDRKLPNNTFQKLFRLPFEEQEQQAAMKKPKKEKPTIFEYENAKGRERKIKLMPG